jgi:hypothetical protein
MAKEETLDCVNEMYDGSGNPSGHLKRNVWLKTLGKIAGLDLYFTARTMK